MHSRRRIVSIAAACVALAASVPATPAGAGGEELPPPRVVGGTEAPPGAYPFMAAVVDRHTEDAWLGLRCGGTIVHDEWVLTSVDCVDGALATHLDVVVARHDLTSGDGLRIAVAEVVEHPSGAALLRLDHAVPITPVGLPQLEDRFEEGTPATVAGWGDTHTADRFPRTLHHAAVPIVGDDACEQTYGDLFDPDSMICTGVPGAGGTGVCDGDGGGPVLVFDGGLWIQAGISSWSLGCGLPDFPAVAVEIEPLLGWIHVATGRDTLACNGLAPTIVGTDSVDFITGTPGDDVIVSLGGRDVVDAGAGDDVVCSGGGRDAVDGGPGADALFGGDDADRLVGNAGNDLLVGGRGDDRLRGSGGDDLLRGEEGDDTLAGGWGADDLYGGPGHDLLRGSGRRDLLDGGTGDDVLSGGGGRDILRGGDGSDALSGDRRRDRAFGGDGDDTILGGPGPDRLSGSAGEDTLEGGPGDDTLRGGAGEDDLDGGEGIDTANGGGGEDRCIAEAVSRCETVAE